MSVSVIVPYRSDGGARDDNWEFLRWLWAGTHPGVEVVAGNCASPEWVKADAIADALSRAHGDIIVMADADVWCESVAGAVDQVESGSYVWAVPHLTVHRLTKIGTMRFKSDQDFEPEDLEEPPYEGVAGGGMFVMQRKPTRRPRLTEGSVAGARRTSQPRWPGRHCTAYRGGELTRCGISGTRRWSATLARSVPRKVERCGKDTAAPTITDLA